MVYLAILFVGPGTILLDVETPDRRGEIALAWVLVGLGALYLVFAIVRIFRGRRDGRWPRRLRDAAIGLGLVVCPLAIMNGLAPWTAAPAVWIVPVMAFLFDRRHALSRSWAAGGQGDPVLRTLFLHVVLDPEAGMPDGEIVRGRFRGRRLSELSLDQLDVLLGEASSDRDSVSILTGIVMRLREAGRHGDDWAGPGTGRGRHSRDGAGGTGHERRGSTTMDVEEAYRVIGVAPGVGDAEILAAHRRLMKLVHPDKGGSDYFASKLNEARDILLGR